MSSFIVRYKFHQLDTLLGFIDYKGFKFQKVLRFRYPFSPLNLYDLKNIEILCKFGKSSKQKIVASFNAVSRKIIEVWKWQLMPAGA
jgi:hypothetical protein